MIIFLNYKFFVVFCFLNVNYKEICIFFAVKKSTIRKNNKRYKLVKYKIKKLLLKKCAGKYGS